MESTFPTAVLRLLVRRWKWIVAGAVVPAVVALLVIIAQPAVYTSTVSVVPQRARTEVNYDTRIRTLSADSVESGQGVPIIPSATAERRQALAQLVRSGEIEGTVRDQLGEKLPANLRAPGQLANMVQGKVVPRSEVIAIEVNAPSPALADDIAATWAKVYEQRINELYATSATGSVQLDQEVSDARKKYEVAEGELTTFVSTVPVGENARQLESKQRLLRELIALRQAEVIDLHKMAHRIDLYIGQAEALQEQLLAAQDNSAAASSATALVLLKTQAFASSMSLPAGLQLQLPSSSQTTPTSGAAAGPATNGVTPPTTDLGPDAAAVSRALQDWTLPSSFQLQVQNGPSTATLAQQRSDIESTIQALRTWRGHLQQLLQQQSGGGADGDATLAVNVADISASIGQAEAEARDLQGKVAGDSARQRSLQQERDVLWDSYTSVLKKAEENRISSLIGTGKEVSIAGRSIAERRSRGLSLSLPLVAAIGASFTACWFILKDLLLPTTTLPRPALNGQVVAGPSAEGISRETVA